MLRFGRVRLDALRVGLGLGEPVRELMLTRTSADLKPFEL